MYICRGGCCSTFTVILPGCKSIGQTLRERERERASTDRVRAASASSRSTEHTPAAAAKFTPLTF